MFSLMSKLKYFNKFFNVEESDEGIVVTPTDRIIDWRIEGTSDPNESAAVILTSDEGKEFIINLNSEGKEA